MLIFLVMAVFALAGEHVTPLLATPPPLATLIKPNIYKKMIDDREIMAHANLDENHYSFYATMLVKAAPALTRKVLTDYQLYAKMIPYVDRADYSADTHILKIEGGVWKFRLKSDVKFEERGERWIKYHIIAGHFTGLGGDIYFEPMGEKGTAVYFDGNLIANHWSSGPPKFVIERGAEIVFGFTGKRMRSYIESQKKVEKKVMTHVNEAPQPRSRL